MEVVDVEESIDNVVLDGLPVEVREPDTVFESSRVNVEYSSEHDQKLAESVYQDSQFEEELYIPPEKITPEEFDNEILSPKEAGEYFEKATFAVALGCPTDFNNEKRRQLDYLFTFNSAIAGLAEAHSFTRDVNYRPW
jgi:hypothetical protein